MKLRRWHRWLGVIFSPFFLITSITGACMLWRDAGLYGEGVGEGLLAWHNWEGLAPYLGVILAAALAMQTVTGLLLARRLGGRRG
jgi:uncharacterized iron-regulated membrane protein